MITWDFGPVQHVYLWYTKDKKKVHSFDLDNSNSDMSREEEDSRAGNWQLNH